MKREREEEKIMEPMFPRLHVNDTEKGGPRAPPRNKMALYEQLSIPSQRFNHPVNKAANSDPPSDQGVGNESGIFNSYQLPARHQSEKLHSQYSNFSIPLAQAEHRNKSDEDDFCVPIFVQSLQNKDYSKFGNDMGREKPCPSNPSNLNQPLNFHKFKRMDMLQSTNRQEGTRQKEDNSKENADNRVKPTSTEKAESLKKQPDSSVCVETRDNPANNIDRLKTHDATEPEHRADSEHVSGENFAALEKIKSSDPVRASPSEDQRSTQDRSFRSVPSRNLERVDSVFETSIVDCISRLDVTSDDVVGIIGQKRFWKARKAILNQQRLFAIQLFELHRLVKVQKLIAASPQLLANYSSYSSKQTKASPRAKIPLNCPIKVIPNVLKHNKDESEKPSQKKESSAENTVGNPSFSSFHNGAPPPNYLPLNGNPTPPPVSAGLWGFNHPQGHQWLIPVMSPSEGLVYKPYSGPGFASPPGPNLNPLTGSFLTPAYGVSAPHQLLHFPPAGPHGYFPTYGVPVMNGSVISGSSVEQPNPLPNPSRTSGVADLDLHHHNPASPDALNSLYVSKDNEVQASTASSRVERLRDSREKGDDAERAGVLPLFPVAPAGGAPNSSPSCRKLARPTQVVKVVPHNARSATESAARIFRLIQEERKQYDSV